ncbi:MAG: polysaccharide biosynthesis C-terminal domain-containing protein [candidate division NC10 bacterium]|nr:polysaccharide biosynthesis C-terminal domain-containing protein [candidate division NC10 bacterium]
MGQATGARLPTKACHMGIVNEDRPDMLTTSMETFTVRLVMAALGVGISILIARTLGPEGRGAYVYPVVLASMLITTLHASLEQANVHLFSGQRYSLADLAANSGFVASVAAGISLLVTVVSLGIRPAGVGGVPPAVLLAALMVVPFNVHQIHLTGLLQITHRMRAVNRVALVSASVQACAIGIFAMVGRLTVLAVVSIASGVGALHWALTARALGEPTLLLPRCIPELLRRSLRFGLSLHLGLVMVFLQLRADVFLLERFSGLAAVGLYTLAVVAAESIWMITDAVAVACLPHQVESSAAESGRITLRACRFNFFLALLAGASLALVSYPAVRLAYGVPFLPAIPALLALLPGVVCYSVQRVCGAYLLRLNHPLRMSGILGGAVILNIALNLVWIPRWGIVGAALASTASYALSAALFLTWAVRVSGLRLWEAIAWVPEDTRTLRRALKIGPWGWFRRGRQEYTFPRA